MSVCPLISFLQVTLLWCVAAGGAGDAPLGSAVSPASATLLGLAGSPDEAGSPDTAFSFGRVSPCSASSFDVAGAFDSATPEEAGSPDGAGSSDEALSLGRASPCSAGSLDVAGVPESSGSTGSHMSSGGSLLGKSTEEMDVNRGLVCGK